MSPAISRRSSSDSIEKLLFRIELFLRAFMAQSPKKCGLVLQAVCEGDQTSSLHPFTSGVTWENVTRAEKNENGEGTVTLGPVFRGFLARRPDPERTPLNPKSDDPPTTSPIRPCVRP